MHGDRPRLGGGQAELVDCATWRRWSSTTSGYGRRTCGRTRRVRQGLRRQHNWVQLVKFCAVGASGYVVNLVVFTLAVKVLGLHHLVGATLAFVVAVTNNFMWNRHWTFGARRRPRRLPGRALLRGQRGARSCSPPRVLELLVSGFGLPRGAGPGDLDRGRHPAQLHREQDVELRARPLAWLTLLLAVLRAGGRRRAPRRPTPSCPASQSVGAQGLPSCSADGATRIAERAREGARARAPSGRRLNPTGLHQGPGPLAGELLRGHAGGASRSRSTTAAGRSWRSGAATRWPGPWRAATRASSAAASTRRGCGSRCACSSSRRSSIRAGRSGCSTSTCWCCWPSAPRTSSSTAGEIGVSVPLVAAGAALPAGAAADGRVPRARADASRWSRWPGGSWLVVGLVLLVAFRIVLNVVDSEVIDVGYAGVIGADRIADGDPLYGAGLHRGGRQGRHLRAGELPLLPALRAGDALERELGRPAGRARRGHRLRPADARRACSCWAGGCGRGRRAGR